MLTQKSECLQKLYYKQINYKQKLGNSNIFRLMTIKVNWPISMQWNTIQQ